MYVVILDYEQSLIFLRDSRVGEHTSVRENHMMRGGEKNLSLRKNWLF